MSLVVSGDWSVYFPFLISAGKCVTEKCESWNYVHTQCNVSGMTEDSRIYSMAVSSLVAGSGIRCNKKSMFGYTERKGIWAAEGCRANFGVCYIEGKKIYCHWVCNYINTTGATNGTGTVYPSGAPEFTPAF